MTAAAAAPICTTGSATAASPHAIPAVRICSTPIPEAVATN